MKFQIVILSALLVSAFALPVPDEEVSPIVVEAKPESVQNVEDKVAEVTKPELRKIEVFKPSEEDKLALSGIIPDSELPQALPEAKKEATKEDDKKADKKEETKQEEKKPELPTEKQTRSVGQEAKNLPSAVVPIAANLNEEPKQLVDELKPAVQEIQPEGKSVPAASTEEKKEEKSAESKPEAKAEDLKSELPAEEKIEEFPARQERTAAKKQVEQIQSAVPSKLKSSESAAVNAAEEAKSGAQPAEANEKIEEPLALASEEKPKELKEEQKPAEPKKILEDPAVPAEPGYKPAAEKKFDEKKDISANEEQKSEERKKPAEESKESDESKESEESREEKKSN